MVLAPAGCNPVGVASVCSDYITESNIMIHLEADICYNLTYARDNKLLLCATMRSPRSVTIAPIGMPARMKPVIVRLPSDKFEELRRRGQLEERDAWQQARWVLLKWLDNALVEDERDRQSA